MKANTTINAMQPITTRQALHLIAKGHAAILVNILRWCTVSLCTTLTRLS